VRSVLALPFLVVACSQSSEPTPAPSTGRDASTGASGASDAASVQDNAAEVALPTPDGPHITLSLLGRYKDPSFGVVDLPAISADGRLIAYVRQLDDGGRGNPNLALVIRPVDWRAGEVIEILATEPRWRPEREAQVRSRLAQANERLASSAWKPMAKPQYEDAANGAVTIAVENLSVRARGNQLEIARARRVLVRRELTRWLGAGAQGCKADPQLRNAHAAGGLLLLEIGFTSDGGCWREPEIRIIRI